MEHKCYSDEIVLELIKSPNHIRGIAKKLNTNQMSTFRKLRELLKENVVDFREDGKNKTYFLKKTIEAKTHILIAENYNLNKTLKKYPILRGTIEKLQNHEKIKLAVLFGSYAKGIAKKDSDIDIYIETDNKNLRQEMESLNSRLSIKIGKFDISSLLIKEIIKNHVIIKGQRNFMKKPDFLIKLVKEGKLELVEPSEEIKQSYIKKSESNLISAKILLDNNRLEESISLAYYSMYHALLALLFRTGIKSENHAASIILLKKIFDLDNSVIAFSKKERVDKQYYVDFEITRNDVKDAINNAENFNNKITDFISKLTNENINKYREKFKQLIK